MGAFDNLPDSVEGGAYPDDPGDFSGWIDMKLNEFRVEPKATRIWLLLKFAADNGVQASLSQNIFTSPADDGEKKCNQITFGKFKQLWKAAGLSEADYPTPNPRAISQAVTAYEGNLVVGVLCGPDGRGYTEAKRFRAKSDS